MFKRRPRRVTHFLSLVVFSLTLCISPVALAVDASVYKALNAPFYDPNSSDVCSLVVPGSSTGPTSDNSIWNSGLKPPYILEQFAIETLKDVAQKMSVPQSDTVTQEHVVALVAFMIGEGGDIENQDLFNPLNTGINDPALINGAAAINGVQSFKSFDAGVEATARTIVGSNQSRLADVLVQPGSTAKQFMYALTYYNKFPGNHYWAQASEPPKQDSYFQERLGYIQQVRNNYAGQAGLVIGTPEKEGLLNITDPSKLQFKVTGDTGASTADSTAGCGDTGVVSSNVVQTALNFSWPTDHGMTPKQEYVDALRQYNPGNIGNGADCGIFVATVMRATGADPNYPLSGTSLQEAYVRAHPEKYDVVDTVSSTADLQPGDILIVNSGNGQGASGHTYIFVGLQPDGSDEASASLGTRMPSLGKSEVVDSSSLHRGNYMRARLK